MALIKEITQDKIEVVGVTKNIQIRTRTARPTSEKARTLPTRNR